MTPLVSVVVPTFNRVHYLKETLNSILEQKYLNLECIVVDAGSYDGTVEYLQGLNGKIQFISEHDNGPQDAINKGWKMARGDILTWLNADDLWEKGAVERAARAFLDHPEADVIYGDYGVIDDKGKRISSHTKVDEWNLLAAVEYCDHIIAQSASFMRRAILEKVGFLYPKLCHDHELWLRLALAGAKFHHVNQVLGLPRRHSGNLGASSELVIPLKVEITKNFFSLPGVPQEMMEIKQRALSNAYLRCIQYVNADSLTNQQKAVKIKWLIEQAKEADPTNTQRIERSGRVLPALTRPVSLWQPSALPKKASGPLLIVPQNPGYEMISNNAPEKWTRVRWPLTIYQKGYSFAAIFCEQRTVRDLDRAYLQRRLGCPVIPILFDAVRQPDNLVQMLGGSPVITMDVPKPGALFLQTPIDERLYQPQAKKTIECLFLGRMRYYRDRLDWAKKMRNVTFIERDDNVPYSEYARKLSSAKTIVNFCVDRTNGLSAMKGRVFEALMAGAILLEQRNPHTRQFLTPGNDYLEWETIEELKMLLEMVQNVPERANAILANAALRARQYSRQCFWAAIERIAK